MNEQLQMYLVKVLEWLESGSAWLHQEIPFYVQELIKYKLTVYWVWLIVFLLYILILAIIAVILIVTGNNYEGEIILPLLFMIPFLILATIKVDQIVKIKVAPRVFIIDYIKSEIK